MISSVTTPARSNGRTNGRAARKSAIALAARDGSSSRKAGEVLLIVVLVTQLAAEMFMSVTDGAGDGWPVPRGEGVAGRPLGGALVSGPVVAIGVALGVTLRRSDAGANSSAQSKIPMGLIRSRTIVG